MNTNNSVSPSKEGDSRREVAKDRKITNRLLVCAAFISLVIFTFFIYDIVFLAKSEETDLEVSEGNVEEAVSALSYEDINVVHKTVENFILSDKSDFLVHLSVDGKYYTSSYDKTEPATVATLLSDNGVSVGSDDIINFDANTILTSDMYVVVDRVTYEEVTSSVEIPHEVIEVPVVYSPYVGKNNGTIKPGANGIKETTRRVKYVNGVETESVTLSETVTKEPVAATAYVDKSQSMLDLGNGAPTEYSRVLDCKFYAYSAAEPGMSSNTATGQPAMVGYVAVDPNIIPLYSKLYIVLDNGFVYGYCYAMDTGGAIKGNTIDLFLPSVPDTYCLGIKTGTVYVITEGK